MASISVPLPRAEGMLENALTRKNARSEMVGELVVFADTSCFVKAAAAAAPPQSASTICGSSSAPASMAGRKCSLT